MSVPCLRVKKNEDGQHIAPLLIHVDFALWLQTSLIVRCCNIIILVLVIDSQGPSLPRFTEACRMVTSVNYCC